MFPSYEAFLGIVATMIDQYAKYIKMAEETPWRRPVAGVSAPNPARQR
jgi:xylulose-5-phosphate/fructose-6-phosphate phosphoketolase